MRHRDGGPAARPAGRAAAARAPRGWLALVLLALVAFAPTSTAQSADPGCRACHVGLEEMHPWQPLGCTDCHGGDGHATRLEDAHVEPRVGWHKDERVAHRDFELEYARFRNPSDLRVVQDTCGECHRRLVEHLQLSLHGTTAGHLNDGLYENGVNPTREAVYGIFGVRDDDPRGPHALSELRAIERLRVPCPELALYVAEDGRLWTATTTVNVGDDDARDRVEMLPPVGVPDAHSLAFDQDEGIGGLVFLVLAQVVPDMGLVGLDDVAVVVPGMNVHRLSPP